uniref:Uncharacterized protein n=1 Tax=Neobodo designis TaxID=312471 RepID=A0A7S1KXY8_NEODS|mmetsp:Transcript_10909/g.33769  ORF Transcript_10909/g.33769 Transcript_10909/m.33769 type:complete len:121 (+) Transcript_10909:218-580(+)
MATAGGMLLMYDESAHVIASTFAGPAPPPPPQPTPVTETLFLLSSTCGGQSATLSYTPFDCNNDNNVSFAVACDNSTNQVIQSWFTNTSCSGGVATQQRYTVGKCYADGAQSKVFGCPSP